MEIKSFDGEGDASASPLPPEILFHRAFQPDRLSTKDRQRYKGRQDLSKLNQPDAQSFLIRLQEAFNQDLASVGGYRFYFDYVEATVENALAFRNEGYSFIGITMPLIDKLWEVCVRLSRSDVVAELVGLEPTGAEDYEKFHALLFRLQLNFVVSHEFTHHFFGHTLCLDTDSVFFNEIAEGIETGNIKSQAQEADADGNAAYLILTNMIDGAGLDHAAMLLKLTSAGSDEQRQAILGCFVVAVGAFFFVRPPIDLARDPIDSLTHPPQAARMDRLMASTIRWCEQYNHGDLAAWMTPDDRFRKLMNGMAVAVWGMNGGVDWAAQTAFLRSEAGSDYMKRLDAAQKDLPGNSTAAN